MLGGFWKIDRIPLTKYNFGLCFGCFRYDEWQATYAEWKTANPEKAAMLQDGVDKKTPSVDELMAAIPEFDQDTNIATRIAGEMVLQVRRVSLRGHKL